MRAREQKSQINYINNYKLLTRVIRTQVPGIALIYVFNTDLILCYGRLDPVVEKEGVLTAAKPRAPESGHVIIACPEYQPEVKEKPSGTYIGIAHEEWIKYHMLQFLGRSLPALH